LKDQIARVVEGRQETKLNIYPPYSGSTGVGDLQAFTAFTSGITSTSEVYSLIPRIQQGVNENARIGNSIMPVKLTTKVNVALKTTGSQNVYVDIYFLTAKGIKCQDNWNQVLTGQLLSDGQNLNIPYDGTSYTAMLPVNKSEFSLIKHKRIKLVSALGDPNTVLSGATGPSTNTYNYTKSFSVNIPVPSKYMYQDSGSFVPTNSFPFMVAGFCATDTNGDLAPT
jgi:hypothetical protein